MGPASQINVQLTTLLAILLTFILLTRAYIRRRNSVIRSIQGPPSSSVIFGWSPWYTFAVFTGFIQQRRE
jgi:hypothetical protein